MFWIGEVEREGEVGRKDPWEARRASGVLEQLQARRRINRASQNSS